MRLSALQRKILVHAQLRARAHTTDLAREIGCRERSVRDFLQEMGQKKILIPFSMINVHALGITDYCLFLTHTSGQKAVREKLCKFFCSHPRVAYAAELSGEYHYTVSFFAHTVVDLDEFFHSLAELVSGVSIEKRFAIRVSWTIFPSKYLYPEKAPLEYLTRGEHHLALDLDPLSQRILTALSLYPREKFSVLSRRLQIPDSTFHDRIAEMHRRKVIVGYGYWLEAMQIGAFPFRLLLQEKFGTKAFRKELFRFALNHPHIVAFVRAIGNWDYELNVEVPEPPRVNALIQELYDRFGEHIDVIRSITHLQHLKSSLYPFPAPGLDQ